jgi:hypothetical protein
MTDWHKRKTEGVSSFPLWLKQAVADYQANFGLQSWSAAVLEILAVHLNQFDEIQFGDADFEAELLAGLDKFESETDVYVSMDDYLRQLVDPPQHGGKRR